MTSHKIIKKLYGYGWTNTNKPKAIKTWCAVCGICDKHIFGSYTRKSAKDALYIHLKKCN